MIRCFVALPRVITSVVSSGFEPPKACVMDNVRMSR